MIDANLLCIGTRYLYWCKFGLRMGKDTKFSLCSVETFTSIGPDAQVAVKGSASLSVEGSRTSDTCSNRVTTQDTICTRERGVTKFVFPVIDASAVWFWSCVGVCGAVYLDANMRQRAAPPRTGRRHQPTTVHSRKIFSSGM